MKKKNNYIITYLVIVILILSFGTFIKKNIELAEIFNNHIIGILVFIILFLISGFIQIIVHELGHLFFGLITGYKFLSFRIANLMIIKKDNKLKLCKMSISGTGGQCIMSPPDIKNGLVNNLLYNLGGVIFNLLLSILVIIISIFIINPYLKLFLIILSMTGMYFFLINGIPMCLNINNDGYNAYLLWKDKNTHYSFWLQLKINEQIILGKNLRDIPIKWFKLSKKDSNNPITNTINVFYCSRLMNDKKFNEAYSEMDKLLTSNYDIVDIHKYLMMLDCIYCELVDNKKNKYLEMYQDKFLQQFISSMKNFPSVLRVRYTYALIKENNLLKANDIKEKFEKIALKYPYPADIDIERELMDYAYNIKTNDC